MTALYNLSVVFVLLFCFGIQEFIPAIEFAQQARVLLPPVFFFSASLSVSFPVMLLLALLTGVIWDARHLPYPPEKAAITQKADHLAGDTSVEKHSAMGDLSLGYSILLFGVAGALMQGIRPLFKRGRWELPVIMVGIATMLWLLIEYLLMSFLRGSFEFDPNLWTKIITNSLLAMLVSPLLLFLLHTLAGLFNYEVRNVGLTYRYHGR